VRLHRERVANGGNILFVGTKRQAKDIVREAAAATGMPFSVDRWLGGTLTNYETVKRSVAKFKKYQQMETSGEMSKLPRKEESAIKREMSRMQRNFNGIAEMGGLPSALFIVDVGHEKIAVAEAARCGIPSVALVDTNSDPSLGHLPDPRQRRRGQVGAHHRRDDRRRHPGRPGPARRAPRPARGGRQGRRPGREPSPRRPSPPRRRDRPLEDRHPDRPGGSTRHGAKRKPVRTRKAPVKAE
jgi:hypothetical protein